MSRILSNRATVSDTVMSRVAGRAASRSALVMTSIAMIAIAIALCLAPAAAWADSGTKATDAQVTSADAPVATAKAANPIEVTAKKAKITIRYALVKKANQTIRKSKAFSISNAKGTVTFKKTSGNSKITVAKNGNITVKKGLKAGTYKINVRVRAAGNSKFRQGSRTVTLKIRLRGDIKGNISYTTGEKIYHLPGDKYYDSTVIDESEGERWFVTESQAKKAGWRHSWI